VLTTDDIIDIGQEMLTDLGVDGIIRPW